MWRYKDLFISLTVLEFKNRYQNTFLGFFWVILSPLAFAGVLYFVFRHLWGSEPNFFINVLVGIMTWRFFTSGSGMGLLSIAHKPNLVTKIYVPRYILVISTSFASTLSAFLEFIILIPIILIIAGGIPLTLLLFPVVHLIFLAFISGLGLILGSFYVYFRDMNQIWEVVINILFFGCPIFYPLSIVPDYLMNIYMSNPITRFILMYRDLMVNGSLPSVGDFAFVMGVSVLVLVFGILIFNALQKRFAEVI
jgi:lipopolysaccharide transport system permease protein